LLARILFIASSRLAAARFSTRRGFRLGPLGEAWSSSASYPAPNNVGFINLGFIWEKGQMKGLPTLGGNNGFATGANNVGEAVGWAENTCHWVDLHDVEEGRRPRAV
jgi:hypothetical protein